MLRLELTPEKASMLTEILEEELGDLRMEIADTDRKDYREELKEREAFLKDILAQLRTPE